MSKDAGVFPCNGMLYLVDTNKDFIKGFLIYDPFNDIGHLRYINLPQGGSWSFKYEVYFTDIVPERPSLNEILNGIRSDVNFLAFHPNDAELVLLKFGSYIVLCNMHTKVFTEIGKLPVDEEFSNVRPPI